MSHLITQRKHTQACKTLCNWGDIASRSVNLCLKRRCLLLPDNRDPKQRPFPAC
jgi:hypothetical protein